MNLKVIEVTKDHYTLENGDVFEHTFDIDETVTCEEFQKLLENAKSIIIETINKVENKDI